MKQKRLFGLLIVTALIAIILLGSSPTAAAPFTQSATQTRTATATVVITPTNTTVPPAGKSVITPTATTVVTPTKTSTSIPPTATVVVTPTATLPKPTATQVVTATVKPTATITPTAVVTRTATITPTATVTKTATATPTKPKVLAPRAGSVAALSTAFTVQNMDQVTNANVTATFYDTAGNPVGSGVTCSNVLPNRGCTVDQRVTGGGLDGQTNWQGSVVLSSNTQLAAVVSEYAGNAASLGMDFRADAYAGWSSIAASTNISIPQLLKSIYDPSTASTYNSTLAVQNTSATNSASVTLTFKQSTGTTYSRVVSIPANSSLISPLETESALTGVSLFYGTGLVTSDQPVAVVVHHNAAGFLSVYSGFASSNAATTLYIPQLLRNLYDPGTGLVWGTGVLVMTADGTSSNVTITYYPAAGSPVSNTQTANPMVTFDQRTTPVLSGTFYGSAVVTANKPVIAITNYVVDYTPSRGVQGATYRAFTASGGGSTVYIPLLRKNSFDSGTGLVWGTGVLGRLVGAGTTTITITYYHSNGSTYTRTVSGVSTANPMFTIDQRGDSGLPDGTMSAVLTSSPPLPFSVIVNVVAPSTALGDALMNFAGVAP